MRALIDEELSRCSEAVRGLLAGLHWDRGKMIRPGLVLLSGLACGRITQEHIRVAAIVEMIHNATLLHDDVIDEGRHRRGYATVNSLRGNECAVLLGDFVLSKVFEMCVELDKSVTGVIASAAARTCEGELRQTLERENGQLSESAYIELISEKSAALFRAGCSLGASLAGADERQREAFAEFGRDIGIAFQITDDLLDMTGNERQMGKTVGRDIDREKMTLPVIHFLRTADEASKDSVKELLQVSGRRGDGKAAETNEKKYLIEKLESCGSLSYTRKRAEELIERAISALGEVEQSDAKAALIETARFVVRRTN